MKPETLIKIVAVLWAVIFPIAYFFSFRSSSTPNPEQEQGIKLDLGQKAFLTQQTTEALGASNLTDLPPAFILSTAAMCTDFGLDTSLVNHNNFFYIEYDSTDELTRVWADRGFFFDHGVKLCSYSRGNRCYIHFVSLLNREDINNIKPTEDTAKITNNPSLWLNRAGYGTFVYDNYPEVRTWFKSESNHKD